MRGLPSHKRIVEDALANSNLKAQRLPPHAPQNRHRGRLRVAAILQSAREVFMEKGYDAATDRDCRALRDGNRLALPVFSFKVFVRRIFSVSR